MLAEPRWAIDGVLARSCRAGYPNHRVGREAVDEWLADAKAMGIRSILCFLPEDQLAYYRDIPGGLLEHYRSHGFIVEHIPIVDPAYDPRGDEQLAQNRARICGAFDNLPKPVLVHCSAGIDRTGTAVDYIRRHLDREGQGKPS